MEFNECTPFDVRDYRPFSVTVSVSLHDIHGHLVKVRNRYTCFTFAQFICRKIQKQNFVRFAIHIILKKLLFFTNTSCFYAK